MRVIIVSTPFIPVPPPTYGGLERVVFDLAHSLKQSGVDVAVACPRESNLPSGVDHIDTGPVKYLYDQDWRAVEEEAYSAYRSSLAPYDVIHDHTWYACPYSAQLDNPQLRILHTDHGHLGRRVLPKVEHLNLVGISQFMQNEYARLGLRAKYAYNGVALDDYPFSRNRGARLLFVGRITSFKQAHVAIGLARLSGVPIDIVGGDRFVDDTGYVELVRNSCDGSVVRYVGEISHEDKLNYLREARAVVIPSAFGEPFGLVAVEALAVGRPVICLRDGALPEIIEHGVTGFVCDSPGEMVSVLKMNLDLHLKTEDCRRRAEQFSRERMAERYLQLYDEVLHGSEW